MRIALMLRCLDEKGGIGVYTRNLTQTLLEADQENEYFLYYRTPSNLGRFSGHANAHERVLQAPNKIIWDQVCIAYACWRDSIDIVFHPKFTVPLLAPCKTAMVLHGAGWFLPEAKHFWSTLELMYARLAMPLYCRRASAILSVSQLTTEVFCRLFHLPPTKIRTVYFGPGKQFKRICDQEQLCSVRKKYELPERFILTLTGYDRGPRKNIDGILAAYKSHHGKTPHKLLIVGKDCHKFRDDFHLAGTEYGQDILFPGWIDQQDLPALYTLADLFLYPSKMEAFPIPVTEALACGTPVITANVNGLKEIAGDAAYLVDPYQPDEIAHAIDRVLSDSSLRQEMTAKGLERAKLFSWEKCAQESLAILSNLTS